MTQITIQCTPNQAKEIQQLLEKMGVRYNAVSFELVKVNESEWKWEQRK